MSVTGQVATHDLGERIADVTILANRPVASPGDVEQLLSEVSQAVLDSDLAAYDRVALKRQALQLRLDLFALRGLLRRRLGVWSTSGLMTHQAQLQVRDCLRAARFACDMLGELANGHARLPDGAAPLKAFTNPANTFMTPAFDNDAEAAFQPGDVLLARGLHHNSAAIARIGDVDSQFSHVGIVHVDKAGRQWMVESLIEDGAVINKLGHSLSHGNGRAVLFRHRDRELAARASQFAYDHVRRSHGTWKRRILYDFTMRLDHRRPLFCSKLVWLAYERASQGSAKVPTYRTRFTMKNRDFIDRIGVKAAETFAPGDIEVDPNFELVAEWQDLRVTSRLRAQDLIMVKLFEWMETYGYVFEDDALIRIVGFFGRIGAHLSEGVKNMLADVVPKVPINMPRKTIAAVAMLHKTAEPLLAEITRLEADHIRQTGLPLHPKQIYASLEQIRARSDRRIGYLVRPGV